MSVYQEWLNSNAYRAYPFKEDTPVKAINDVGVSLPKYLFVDLVLTIAAPHDVTVRLSQLAFVGDFITAVFVDSTQRPVTTLTVNTAVHTANTAYALVGQGIYEDARGKAVLGPLDQLKTDLPEGIYTFAAELETCTVRPDIRGVRSLQVGSGGNLSAYIGGIVKLIEGTNIRLTYLPDVNGIRIDAIAGDGLNEQPDCDDAYELPQCIRSINGVSIQDVVIVGDGKCVEVKTAGNKITISDKCSQPCCGCNELEFITTNLELLQSTLKRLESFETLLQDRLTNLVLSMLANEKGSA
jgi:hypothetical protein